MKWQLLLLLLCCISSIAASGQLKVTVLDEKAIPPAVKYSGKLVYAVEYRDNLGDHIWVASETAKTKTPHTSPDADSHDASLYAYHYKVLPDSIQLTWKLTDYVKACEFDISAAFFKNAFSITDLNQDGTAETWLMYTLACRSDISPAAMKIIMYENGRKFAVRGINKVKISEKDYAGGEYSFDEAFKNGPAIFRQYASKRWEKNILETWE